MGVITISRQIGAGDKAIAPAVAESLGWQCIDHAELDAAVAQSGATLPSVTHFDEHAPALLESWKNPGQAARYMEVLKGVVKQYAEAGNVVLVGRGASFILHEHDILSVRL